MIGDMTEDMEFPDKLKLIFQYGVSTERKKMVYEMAVRGKSIGSLVRSKLFHIKFHVMFGVYNRDGKYR
jgi:hypothetical protein